DDRNRLRGGIRLELARSLPAVNARQAHVHQDQRGRLGSDHREPALAVDRREDLVATALQAPREHVTVHLVVLDQQDLGHQRAPPRRATQAVTRSWTSRSSDSRVWVPFSRIRSTLPFKRARSSSEISLPVTTMIGIERHAGDFRNSATNSKPSISGMIRSSTT